MKESEITHFIKNIENSDVVNGSIVWDKKVNSYVESLNRVKLIANHETIRSEISQDLMKRIDKFIDKSTNPEFHIALVGSIKAGKSTLLNAILGGDLASSSVTPETASLTKFKATQGSNYIKLDFYTIDEWKNLWSSVQNSKSEVFMEKYNDLNGDVEKVKWIGKQSITKKFDNIDELKAEIKKWTSCTNVTHYFVKEVEVGLKGFKIPTGVVFVDTPGLDDPVRYRSDITRSYIDRANSVLVCVNSSALTGQELATIYGVFANARYSKDKIYIVGTQTDTLNNPLEDWEKQKKEWVTQLKRKDAYGDELLANRNILGVSGYIENIVRNYKNTQTKDLLKEIVQIGIKYNLVDIMEVATNPNYDFSNLGELLRGKSGYNEFSNTLNCEIIDKHAGLLAKEIGDEYLQLRKDILDKFIVIGNREKELLKVSEQGKNQLLDQKNSLQKKLKESREEQKEIQKFLNQIHKVTNERAEKLFKQIENIWRVI